MTSPARDILDSLPHRPPFRFITEVLELGNGESAKGIWRVRGNEDFFCGHFPDHPIVPGVLIGEALAQLSGLIIIDRLGPSNSKPYPGGGRAVPSHGKLAHIEIRFSDAVTPPADILLECKFERVLGALWQFDAAAKVADRRVARGTLTLAIPPSVTARTEPM